MDRQYRIDSFDLDRDITDHEVDAIAKVQHLPAIDGRERHLALEGYAAAAEVFGQATLVPRAQRAGAEVTVHLDGSSDDMMREGIKADPAPASLWHGSRISCGVNSPLPEYPAGAPKNPAFVSSRLRASALKIIPDKPYSSPCQINVSCSRNCTAGRRWRSRVGERRGLRSSTGRGSSRHGSGSTCCWMRVRSWSSTGS